MPKLSHDGPCVHANCEITESSFGAFCEVGAGSRIVNCVFEDYAYCDRLADIANTTVGKFSNIAAMTRIGPTDHPFAQVAQHHFLYRSSYYWGDVEDDAEFFAARSARRTVLGADCWLGHGAIVKPQINIGIGAIVASGAVVTKDVAPFMIVAGCPATPIRARFTDLVIDRLLALAWWEWNHTALRGALTDFRKLRVDEFLEKYQG